MFLMLSIEEPLEYEKICGRNTWLPYRKYWKRWSII